jgi:hypothetical protein
MTEGAPRPVHVLGADRRSLCGLDHQHDAFTYVERPPLGDYGLARSNVWLSDATCEVCRNRVLNPEVHLLWSGHALCGKPGVPGEWGSGQAWLSLGDFDTMGEQVTCPGCLVAQKHQQLRDVPADRRREPVMQYLRGRAEALRYDVRHELRFLEMQLQIMLGRHPDAAQLILVQGPTPGLSTPVPTDAGTPVRAALLTPETELALLEAVFAWRAQGTLTRWKTEPSRTLAKLVKRRLAEELPPDALEHLEKQARERVAEDALTRRYAIQESKGRARELQALFENLAEISERLALVVEEEHFAADEQLDWRQAPRREQTVSFEVEELDQVNGGRAVWAASDDGFDTREQAEQDAREMATTTALKSARVVQVTRTVLDTYGPGPRLNEDGDAIEPMDGA